MDWLVGTMAHSARTNYGGGGFSQSVLDFDGVLSEQALRMVLNQISNRFPLIHGRVARDWTNLAPYWKVSPPSQNSAIPLRSVDLSADEFDRSEQLFAEHANAPIDFQRQHLRFLLVGLGQSRSRLGMMFDHRLFDAFGADMFLRLIDLTWQGRLDEVLPCVQQTEPAHLDHWKRRFESGRTLNRMLIRLSEQPVCSLGMPPNGSFRPIVFLHDRLTLDESARFTKKAGEEISLPVILPSATARAILAMRETFADNPLPGSQYLVFTSGSLRTPGREWESLLFNRFSIMPFSLEAQAPLSPKQAAIALRDQLFEHMKQQTPFVTDDASALGRICPLWIGIKLLRIIAKGRMCSFYFACLREKGFSEESFMGQAVVDLTHKPLVFSPPGLNLCMTNFRDRFNLVISYLEGVIDDATAGRLMQHFKASLLQ
jgi:hypothetical protein